MSYFNFLIQLTEKDKRLLIALFIILIIIFVLVAYIGQGLRALMKRYSKGIDGYMHELCSAKLVTTPKEFRRQVFKKESKVLYQKTRWVLRIFILCTVGFVIYSLVAKPGGDATPFAYVWDNIANLFFKFDCPRGNFFGIDNFPVDWPYISKKPSLNFSVPSVVSYSIFLIWIITLFGLFTSTLSFIAKLHRAKVKSVDVFTRSLDDVSFIGD